MIMVMAYHFVMLVAQPIAYKPSDNVLLLEKILYHDLYHLVRVRGGGVRTKNMVDVRCVLKGGNCPLNAYVEQRKS